MAFYRTRAARVGHSGDGPPDVQARLARIAAAVGGAAGVAAMHLESGARVSFNGELRFPMASTVKVPIALAVLALVDRNIRTLDDVISLAPSDVQPGSGLIARHFTVPGVALSVRNLLELSLTVSDNSASDVLLKVAGGPAAVTDALRARGVDGMSVDRSLRDLLAELLGVEDVPQDEALTPGVWRKLTSRVPPHRRLAAVRALMNDVRDTSSPRAQVNLLAALARGDALSAASTAVLLGAMSRCEGGPLSAGLPPGTRVAHKSGALSADASDNSRRILTADFGIVNLPAQAGRIAIAAAVLDSPRATGIQQLAVARMARAAFDHFSRSSGR